MTSCPHCGCNVCELEETGRSAGGRPWARYRCDNEHCQRSFYDGEKPRSIRKTVIIIPAPRCPACQSVNTRSNGSHKPKDKALEQYLRQNRICNNCRHPFVVLKQRTGDPAEK